MAETAAWRRGDVSVADAVAAASRLGLDGGDLVTLTELLGLRLPPVTSPARKELPEPSGTSERGGGGSSAGGRSGASGPSSPVRGGRRRTVVTPLPDDDTVGVVTTPEEPETVAVDADVPVLAYRPPVPGVQLRAALTALVRRPRASRRPDPVAVVRALAERRPMPELPCEREESVAGGVVVLADVSRLMTPYVADVTHLVEQLRLAVGTPNTVVHRLRGAAVDRIVATLTAASDADVARPVVVVSVLGRVGTGLVLNEDLAWFDLPERLAAAGLDVVALVPHRSTARRAGGRQRVVAWDDLPMVGRGCA